LFCFDLFIIFTLGTPYEDVFAEKTWREVAPLNYAPGKPFFAFPAIAHGDFFLSQTPVIIRYSPSTPCRAACRVRVCRELCVVCRVRVVRCV